MDRTFGTNSVCSVDYLHRGTLVELLDITTVKPYWRILDYGLAGSAKTTLAGTACLDKRLAPVLWIDAGGNPISLKRLGVTPKIIKMTKLEDLNYIHDWLYKGQPDNHVMTDKAGCVPGYKTVVLDGITRIQFFSFKVAMGNIDTPPGTMPTKPEWDHYARVLLNLTNAFTQFYDLKMHVIVTALEDYDKRFYDPDDTKLKPRDLDDSDYFYQAVPAIDGKSAERVPGMAELVIRMAHKSRVEVSTVKQVEKQFNRKVEYSIAQLKQTKAAYAKDQYNLGVDYLPDLTMTQLTDLLER